MASTNRYPGLARGPLDHDASAVINVIADDAIEMGSVVRFVTPLTSEFLPRVAESSALVTVNYGIVVGGDNDGVYGNGSTSGGDSTKAALSSGQTVVLVTQGRALARVVGPIGIGDALVATTTPGVLQGALATGRIIARTLQGVGSGDTDMIAVDVQREGIVA